MNYIKILASYGFFAGIRDYSVKPEFYGKYMVVDTQDKQGFSIVGDNLEELCLEAVEHLELC